MKVPLRAGPGRQRVPERSAGATKDHRMEATTTPRTEDAVVAVRLGGRLDGRCTAELRQNLQQHLEAHPGRDVVIDMTDVESVDLTVLNLLSALAVRVAKSG